MAALNRTNNFGVGGQNSLNHKAAASSIFYAKALFNFTGQDEKHLSLKKGSTIKVISYSNADGWSLGEDVETGNQGYFPTTFIASRQFYGNGAADVPSASPSLPLPVHPVKRLLLSLQQKKKEFIFIDHLLRYLDLKTDPADAFASRGVYTVYPPSTHEPDVESHSSSSSNNDNNPLDSDGLYAKYYPVMDRLTSKLVNLAVGSNFLIDITIIAEFVYFFKKEIEDNCKSDSNNESDTTDILGEEKEEKKRQEKVMATIGLLFSVLLLQNCSEKFSMILNVTLPGLRSGLSTASEDVARAANSSSVPSRPDLSFVSNETRLRTSDKYGIFNNIDDWFFYECNAHSGFIRSFYDQPSMDNNGYNFTRKQLQRLCYFICELSLFRIFSLEIVEEMLLQLIVDYHLDSQIIAKPLIEHQVGAHLFGTNTKYRTGRGSRLNELEKCMDLLLIRNGSDHVVSATNKEPTTPDTGGIGIAENATIPAGPTPEHNANLIFGGLLNSLRSNRLVAVFRKPEETMKVEQTGPPAKGSEGNLVDPVSLFADDSTRSMLGISIAPNYYEDPASIYDSDESVKSHLIEDFQSLSLVKYPPPLENSNKMGIAGIGDREVGRIATAVISDSKIKSSSDDLTKIEIDSNMAVNPKKDNKEKEKEVEKEKEKEKEKDKGKKKNAAPPAIINKKALELFKKASLPKSETKPPASNSSLKSSEKGNDKVIAETSTQPSSKSSTASSNSNSNSSQNSSMNKDTTKSSSKKSDISSESPSSPIAPTLIATVNPNPLPSPKSQNVNSISRVYVENLPCNASDFGSFEAHLLAKVRNISTLSGTDSMCARMSESDYCTFFKVSPLTTDCVIVDIVDLVFSKISKFGPKSIEQLSQLCYHINCKLENIPVDIGRSHLKNPTQQQKSASSSMAIVRRCMFISRTLSSAFKQIIVSKCRNLFSDITDKLRQFLDFQNQLLSRLLQYGVHHPAEVLHLNNSNSVLCQGIAICMKRLTKHCLFMSQLALFSIIDCRLITDMITKLLSFLRFDCQIIIIPLLLQRVGGLLKTYDNDCFSSVIKPMMLFYVQQFENKYNISLEGNSRNGNNQPNMSDDPMALLEVPNWFIGSDLPSIEVILMGLYKEIVDVRHEHWVDNSTDLQAAAVLFAPPVPADASMNTYKGSSSSSSSSSSGIKNNEELPRSEDLGTSAAPSSAGDQLTIVPTPKVEISQDGRLLVTYEALDTTDYASTSAPNLSRYHAELFRIKK